MQKSGFFNALRTVNGDYDRKYNANDYCDNLAVVISNGVLRGVDDDLKVTASGMVVTVGKGRAWINGHYFYNDTAHTFAPTYAPSGGARYDRVFLRLDNSLAVRSVTLVYEQGAAGNYPTPPEPVRTNDIYDLVLADIYIGTQSTSVTVTDRRGDAALCGWVYSTSGDNSFFTSLDAAFDEWFTDTKTDFAADVEQFGNEFDEWFTEKRDTLSSTSLFKRYNWRTVLDKTANAVSFNVPQYDAATCFVEVYVNGLLETAGNDYTLNGNVVTFTYNKTVGTEIEVKVFKSLDGTGIMTVADEITALQNAVANLSTAYEYEYTCNGYDDNVKLSEIAQEWLSGTDTSKKIIKVYGTFGANAPYAGTGAEATGYQWLALGMKDSTTRRIIFDFSGVNEIKITCRENTKNIIFYGADVHVIGANVQAIGAGTSTNVIMFSGRVGEIKAENCSFSIAATGSATVAESGTFENCKTWIYSTNSNAATFAPVTNSRPVVVFGGTHYAYSGNNSGNYSSVFYTAAGAANAVIMAYGVNVPTVALSGYYQTNASRINAGKCYISGITTTLALTDNTYTETNGHILINKP